MQDTTHRNPLDGSSFKEISTSKNVKMGLSVVLYQLSSHSRWSFRPSQTEFQSHFISYRNCISEQFGRKCPELIFPGSRQLPKNQLMTVGPSSEPLPSAIHLCLEGCGRSVSSALSHVSWAHRLGTLPAAASVTDMFVLVLPATWKGPQNLAEPLLGTRMEATT